MKKLIHPTQEHIKAELNTQSLQMDRPTYKVTRYNAEIFYGHKEELLALGFIEAPTEEVKGDWIDKVMNDMEHIKFRIDSRYCDWEQCRKEVRQSIEKHKPIPFDNGYYKQPVEQELIPLLPRDIVAITDEIITLDELGKVDEDRIHKILSKYGVPKQEEKYIDKKEVIKQAFPNHLCDSCGEVHGILTSKCKGGNFQAISTPTPQATSVDVEELKTLNSHELMLYDMESMMYTQLYTLREQQTHENRINIAKSYIKKRQERGFFSLPIQKKRSREDVKKWFDGYIRKLGFGGHKFTYEGIIAEFLKDNNIYQD